MDPQANYNPLTGNLMVISLEFQNIQKILSALRKKPQWTKEDLESAEPGQLRPLLRDNYLSALETNDLISIKRDAVGAIELVSVMPIPVSSHFTVINNVELQLAVMLYNEVGRINRAEKRYATLDDLKHIPREAGNVMDGQQLKEFIYSLPVCYLISPCPEPEPKLGRDSFYIKGENYHIIRTVGTG